MLYSWIIRPSRSSKRIMLVSPVLRLQEELITAQSRLQEVQKDLTELRRVLQETQNQLRDREAENVLMKTGFISRPQSIYCRTKRPEEAFSQQSVLQSTLGDPFLPSRERISRYLLSLDQTHTEAAEGEENPPFHPEHRDQPPQTPAVGLNSPLRPSRGSEHLESGRRQLFASMMSQSDGESVFSDCSMKSGWTFDTRDEAAFRDGLAALDASISSLQRTIQGLLQENTRVQL
uniref:Uncharacterized protein n=1 Tax=Acanthochromis polyacanthus TaxID=80966 RepID=A0A3Q1FPT0_9TELE